MDLVLPFWNFIVGELTGVTGKTLDIPDGQDDCLFRLIFLKIVYYFIYLISIIFSVFLIQKVLSYHFH